MSDMWFFGSNSDDEGIDIFIGNLPDNTSISDIEALLGVDAADATLKLSSKQFSDGSSINFCVAPFHSKKRGEKVMKSIRHKKLGGAFLKVHEFHYRSFHNDRRHNSLIPMDESDRRHTD
ncbi:MAG: hypothetical protein GQ470_03015, partial [Gammaproteobacteria bacterium]|nr:hypothetical protein [Gammaproteobacteria bacterium]